VLLDLKPAVLEALRSPEARDLLRQLLEELQPADKVVDALVDAVEAGRILGMTPGAVRQAARHGTLPVTHLGRRVRFRRAELLALFRHD
jgi:hypothetical protein